MQFLVGIAVGLIINPNDRKERLRMKGKRFVLNVLTLALSFVMILSASITFANFNETGYPIVDEPITLQMMGRRAPIQPAWESMGFFQEMQEMTNIAFRFR